MEDLFLESQMGAQGLLTWELSVNSIFFGALHSPFICCQYIFTGNDHELSCSFRQDSLIKAHSAGHCDDCSHWVLGLGRLGSVGFCCRRRLLAFADGGLMDNSAIGNAVATGVNATRWWDEWGAGSILDEFHDVADSFLRQRSWMKQAAATVVRFPLQVDNVSLHVTLWKTNITVENHNFQWVNPLFPWPCSIAMWNNDGKIWYTPSSAEVLVPSPSWGHPPHDVQWIG